MFQKKKWSITYGNSDFSFACTVVIEEETALKAMERADALIKTYQLPPVLVVSLHPMQGMGGVMG